MAEKETQKILSPELTQAEKVMLAQTISTPGWKIIEKIAKAAIDRAAEETIQVSQESEDYERIVVERQRRARNIGEFSDLFILSILSHARSVLRAEQRENLQAVESVGAMFGIHPAKKEKKDGDPSDAIGRTFGIHPAKPKKSPEGKK
jgi:hypothetical protein